MPITKHNYTVRRVEDLADTMRAAFRIAQSGRKGPVLVDIPKDITAASCEFTPKAPELIRTVTRYNEEDVKKAAQMINESERPIVYFGGGVRSAAGCQPLRDLLEKTGMPATYTLMAAGVLSYGEPHNLGLLGMRGCYAANKAIDEADLVIAVGGGVVGDLAGFAASIYMRGIDFINCPTTTLSMIDSSIGGKTAVDLGDTKNIVGAFWQPKLVIVDPATLSTLPRRHYINGLAEAVKAGLLADPELFAIFEKGDIDTQISEIIYRSLRFKKNVVEQDETERGMRKALNFGHTIGHGIEAVKGIKGRRTVGLFHGECVALGMLPMIESKALQKRVRAVYRRIGLPTRTTYNKEKVMAELLHDKKAQGGQITVIKVPGLGCWRAETIPVEGLRPLLGMED